MECRTQGFLCFGCLRTGLTFWGAKASEFTLSLRVSGFGLDDSGLRLRVLG